MKRNLAAESTVRLVNSQGDVVNGDSGLLEMRYTGNTWGKVWASGNSDGTSSVAWATGAKQWAVACRELGYSRGTAASEVVAAATGIWLRYLSRSGSSFGNEECYGLNAASSDRESSFRSYCLQRQGTVTAAVRLQCSGLISGPVLHFVSNTCLTLLCHYIFTSTQPYLTWRAEGGNGLGRFTSLWCCVFIWG